MLDAAPDDGPRLLVGPTAGGRRSLAATVEDLGSYFAVLEATVGAGRLGLVHANDSLDGCGSRRDRHTTIGAGSIGVAPFAELLAHPSMAAVPVVVETPSEGDGHARGVALLNDLAVRRTAPRKGAVPLAG